MSRRELELFRIEHALSIARWAIKAWHPRSWSVYLQLLDTALDLEFVEAKS